MPDYTALAATALRLVKDSGRLVQFRKLNSDPVDNAKPWRGAADPTVGGVTVDAYAVAVPPSSASALGLSTSDSDLVKRSEQILIVAPASADLAEFHEVIDGRTWRITGVETLRPADTTLLYFVGVAQ